MTAAEVAGGVAVEPVAWEPDTAMVERACLAMRGGEWGDHQDWSERFYFRNDMRRALIAARAATPTPRPVGLSEEEEAVLRRITSHLCSTGDLEYWEGCGVHGSDPDKDCDALDALVRRLTNQEPPR